MPHAETCRPTCIHGVGDRPSCLPSVPYGRICGRCGATIWHFPEEHRPGTDVTIPRDVMEAARRGELEGLLRCLVDAVAAGWWITPREWAVLAEAIHPDLGRWAETLAQRAGLKPLRDGVSELMAERGREREVVAPALRFAVRTEQLPPGVRRAGYGRSDVAAAAGDVLVLGMSGPTAADFGHLVRWRRGDRPEVVREGGRFVCASAHLWCEQTPSGVALLHVPPRGDVRVLESVQDASWRLVSFPFESDKIEFRWHRAGAAHPRDGRTQIRALDGTVLETYDQIGRPTVGANLRKHPLDDGYSRCVINGGDCWARNGVVRFAPLDARAPWEERGTFKWASSDRHFLLTTFDGEAPARYRVVDAFTGDRSVALELARPPSALSVQAVADGLVIVADGRYAFATPTSAVVEWKSLPYAARVALGESYGARVVLGALDVPQRYLVVDVRHGIVGDVCDVTAVRALGFGPVFLSDTWWGVVVWDA